MAGLYLMRCKQENILRTEMFSTPKPTLIRACPFEVVIKGLTSACERARTELGVSAA